MPRIVPLSLAFLALCMSGSHELQPAPGGSSSSPSDEDVLKAARIGIDGPSLLNYLRKQMVAPADREKIESLIRQLGSEVFEAREAATAALIEWGAPVKPYLRQTLESLRRASDADPEVLRRAEECLRRIGDQSHDADAVLSAVLRTLARLKTEGSVEVILAYLPGAPSERLLEEIRSALTSLAADDAKAVSRLLEAINDKTVLRRAVAAAALCRTGSAPAREAVRKLLRDPEALVRHRVAVEMALAGEKDAIPVLVEVIGERALPQAQAYQAEQLLCRLAGEQAPATTLTNDPTARSRCRDAWMAWWKEHGAEVDPKVLAEPPPLLGYTLIVLLDDRRVLELDAQNQVRWELKGIAFPLDAQLLPGGRILLAEQEANRVTERSLKGDILWQWRVMSPLMAQRLDNGNTFVATRERIVEVDRDGKEVFSHEPPNGESMMRAQRLASGQIAMITTDGQATPFRRLDPTGTSELASFPVRVRTSGGRIEVLPNLHVLVPEKDDHRVAEYDTRGRVVHQIRVREPIAAVRLPNGNTLVTSMADLRAVELDKDGNEVWQYKLATKVTRAFRR